MKINSLIPKISTLRKEKSIKQKAEYFKNLNKNLKQLEFISCFEMHLDTKKEQNYSLAFLQQLEQIKSDKQKHTILSIQNCIIQ